MEDSFDRKDYLEGAGYLRRFFLGGYLQPNSICNEPSAFEQRIGLLVDQHSKHFSSPVDVAREFWQVSAPPTQVYATSAMLSGKYAPGKFKFGVPILPDPTPPKQAAENFDQKILPWLVIAKRLIMHSGCVDAGTFFSWLDARKSEDGGLREIVEMGRIVDNQYYLDAYQDVLAAGMDPLEHFLSYGFIEGRLPRAQLSTGSVYEMLISLKLAAKKIFEIDYLPDYPLSHSEIAARQTALTSIQNPAHKKNNLIAVVAHLYYRDLVPALLERLSVISEDFDLYVTLPDWGTGQIKKMVRAVYPEAIFYHAANRGRDIGPFVDILPLIINRNYDAVLKIQTKRGYYQAGRLLPEQGDLWREESFDALLGSAQRVSDILEAFRTEARLGIIGPSPYFVSLDDYPYHDQGYLANTLLGDGNAIGFFAGTMFWFRPEYLKDLVEPGNLSITKFPPETGANDGALAHLTERMFGHAATAKGFEIAGAPVSPDMPLDFCLKPMKGNIHDYLTNAIALSRANRNNKAQ